MESADAPPPSRPRERDVSALQAWAWIAFVVVVVGGLLLWWAVASPAPRSLADLSPEERRREVALITAELTALCSGDLDRELSAHCQHLAELVVRLPECADPCRELAEPHLRHPDR